MGLQAGLSLSASVDKLTKLILKNTKRQDVWILVITTHDSTGRILAHTYHIGRHTGQEDH